MVGFYLKRPGVLAFGIANTANSTFIVCAGSIMRNKQAGNMSIYRKRSFNLRKRLIKIGIVSSGLVFLENYEFKNISEATSVIMGQSRSGDLWINATGQTYPEWKDPHKQKLIGPIFKRGSRFTNNNNERYLIRDVVTNRDEDNRTIYEYLLRPIGGTHYDDVLVPEHEVLISLKRLIKTEIHKHVEGM